MYICARIRTCVCVCMYVFICNQTYYDAIFRATAERTVWPSTRLCQKKRSIEAHMNRTCNMYVCVYMCMCLYLYMYMYVHARTHTHTHICICTHTRTHIYTHIKICTCVFLTEKWVILDRKLPKEATYTRGIAVLLTWCSCVSL
jgi:hypothetical protein